MKPTNKPKAGKKRTPKKPAPFARLVWAPYNDPNRSRLVLYSDKWHAEDRIDNGIDEAVPVLVIDARPESLEAMKEAGARAWYAYCAATDDSFDVTWEKLPEGSKDLWRAYVAALMQSWGLTRGTV